MISYFLLSALLLTVGMLIYAAFFRERVSAAQAKTILFFVLILSLGIPYFVPGLPNYSQMLREGKVFYEDYTEWNVVDISDKALLECYNKALDSKDVCDCEIIQKASKVTFTYHPVYNFFVLYGGLMVWGFYAVSIILAAVFLLRLMLLILLINRSLLYKENFKGFSFYMLYPFLSKPLPLSAISLYRNYIVWSPLLDSLKENDRNIVLEHEVAHLKNRDSWYLIFFELVKAVLWITPAYYFFVREFKKIQEYLADESAANSAGSRRQYAGLLLRVKEWQLVNNKSLMFSAMFSGSVFKKRILRLLSSKRKKLNPSLFFLSFLLLFGLLWFAGSYSMPLIQNEELKLKQYELLSGSHSQQLTDLQGK